MTDEQIRQFMQEMRRTLDEAFERGAERLREAMTPAPEDDARQAQMAEDVSDLREAVDQIMQRMLEGDGG